MNLFGSALQIPSDWRNQFDPYWGLSRYHCSSLLTLIPISLAKHPMNITHWVRESVQTEWVSRYRFGSHELERATLFPPGNQNEMDFMVDNYFVTSSPLYRLEALGVMVGRRNSRNDILIDFFPPFSSSFTAGWLDDSRRCSMDADGPHVHDLDDAG